MSSYSQYLIREANILLDKIEQIDLSCQELETAVAILEGYVLKLTNGDSVSGINNKATISYEITDFVRGV